MLIHQPSQGWNFQIAALNHSGQGIDLATWEQAYNDYKGIFDASLKDPLVRWEERVQLGSS